MSYLVKVVISKFNKIIFFIKHVIKYKNDVRSTLCFIMCYYFGWLNVTNTAPSSLTLLGPLSLNE